MYGKKISGRGIDISVSNKFSRLSCDLHELFSTGLEKRKTRIYIESPKKIITANNSPDIPFKYSINPYQGCEHGCVYCYSRNSHHYWGFGSGIDFESRIIAKPDAPGLLENDRYPTQSPPEIVIQEHPKNGDKPFD